MRTYDIPYVSNPAMPSIPEDYRKMTLEQLKNKHIKMCGKANGDISICSRCKTPCEYGKRAIQLVATEVYNNPPVPLYGGKTLIERAREENAKWHQEHDKKPNNPVTEIAVKPEKPKVRDTGKRKYVDGWWELSLQAEDQLQWIMDAFGCSKTQAKKKIYMHNYNKAKAENKGESKEMKAETKAEPKVETKVDTKVNTEVETKAEEPKDNRQRDVVFLTLEAKINELMQQQSEYKAKLDEYTKLHAKVSEQIDVLCKALDVFEK